MLDFADKDKFNHGLGEADVTNDSADSDENGDSTHALDVKEVVTSDSFTDSEKNDKKNESANDDLHASSSLMLLGHSINVDDNVIDLDHHDLNYDDEENDDQKVGVTIQKYVNSFEEMEMTAEKISDISSSDDDDEEVKSSVTVSSVASSQYRQFRHIRKLSDYNKSNELGLLPCVIAEERGEVISDDDGEVMDSERAEKIVDITGQSKLKEKKKVMEDGEIDDLEDGELKSDSDDEIAEISEKNFAAQNLSSSVTAIASFKSHSNTKSERSAVYSICASQRLPENGVCRFFLRGMCTWGEGCKYFHPPESKLNHYTQIFRQQRQPQTQPFIIPNNNDFVSKSESKPLSLFSIPMTDVPNHRSVLLAPGHSGAEGGNVESAWERGLRQAREFVKKRQSGSSDYLDDVHMENDHNDLYRESENRSTFSSSPSTSAFRSSYSQSNNRKLSFSHNQHLNDCAPNSSPIADSMRYEEVSDDEIPTTNGERQEIELKYSTKHDYDSSHRTRIKSDTSSNSTVVRHHHPPIRAPNSSSKSRCRNSDSSEDDGAKKLRLKSKVVQSEKKERLTLKNFHSSASAFSDPWARNNFRNRRVSGSSGSSKSIKLNLKNFFDENEEDTPAAYRKNKKVKTTSTNRLPTNRFQNTTERLRKISTSSSSPSSAVSSRASSSDLSLLSNRQKVDDGKVYKQRSRHISNGGNNDDSEDSENEVNKKRKREVLLQKLKTVEEAIAKKRKKIGA